MYPKYAIQPIVEEELLAGALGVQMKDMHWQRLLWKAL